jgi:hypothetical protein
MFFLNYSAMNARTTLANSTSGDPCLLVALDKVTDFQPNAGRGSRHWWKTWILREWAVRFRCIPTAKGTGRNLTEELSGDYAGLIRPVLGQNNLVEGRRYARWQHHFLLD